MKRDTKKIILEKAYLLFLEKGYDAVSISMIQKEAGIGRATMYHHFSSKQDLFTAVIETYFKSAEAAEQSQDMSGVRLSGYLEERIRKAKLVLEHSPLPDSIGMLNYFILTFQALEMDPEMAEYSHKIHESERQKWERIISNSIEAGEVSEGIDVTKTANLFMNIRHGVGVTATFNTTMKDSVEAIDEMYQYIFSLIKT